jgi:hypothetical protein
MRFAQRVPHTSVWTPTLQVTKSTGIITTVAGKCCCPESITNSNTDGNAATDAQLSNAVGVLIDPSGNIYISQLSNGGRVRKVDAATGDCLSKRCGRRGP